MNSRANEPELEPPTPHRARKPTLWILAPGSIGVPRDDTSYDVTANCETLQTTPRPSLSTTATPPSTQDHASIPPSLLPHEANPSPPRSSEPPDFNPSPFTFKPKELAERAERNALEELVEMGGTEGLLMELGTNTTRGLSVHAIGDGPGGGDNPLKGVSIEELRRIYGINDMPVQRRIARALVQFMCRPYGFSVSLLSLFAALIFLTCGSEPSIVFVQFAAIGTLFCYVAELISRSIDYWLWERPHTLNEREGRTIKHYKDIQAPLANLTRVIQDTGLSEETLLPSPKRSLGPLEWIPQAKDPTVDSREIVQLSSPASSTTPIPSSHTPTPSSQDTESPRALIMSPDGVNSVTPPGRPLQPLEWIPQAKDPTHHYNACENISLPPAPPLDRLEWIPEVKDLTPTSHSERTMTTCGPPPKRTLDAIEWIPQDKDPTTAPRETVQVTNSTTEQPGYRQMRSDAEVGPPVATRKLSISWICRIFRVRSRAVEVQQDGESAVATVVTPTSSVTPSTSLSTVVVPSSEGHECPSPSLFPSAAKLSEPPKLSLDPVNRVPQAKDPTTHSSEVAMDERTDATARHVVPGTRDPPPEPTFNGVDPPSGSTDGDFVRDLTDLVTPGPMIYCGRYSDVYQGVCDQKLVAIKVIKSLPSDSVDAVQRRMRREVKTASRFKHPNVLAVYGKVDWGTFGGIITLWCPNGDARSYLRTVPLPPSARLRMTRGVTAGLEYIHGLSVVHGDLKPGNILIDASGNPLICDFGLVCILDAEQPERAADNTTTIHPGTVRFLSYELAQDPPEPRTGASDIHALGCVTYEFLYLERPHSARNRNNVEFHIFRDIATGVPPARRPTMELSTSLAALWSLLESCWDQKPYRRPVISSFSNSLRLLTESDLQHHLL